MEAELAYGRTRGCFQKPKEDIPPKAEMSCPEITPIEFDTRETNRDAMKNQSNLIHPDVSTSTRYVLGTRLVLLTIWEFLLILPVQLEQLQDNKT